LNHLTVPFAIFFPPYSKTKVSEKLTPNKKATKLKVFVVLSDTKTSETSLLGYHASYEKVNSIDSNTYKRRVRDDEGRRAPYLHTRGVRILLCRRDIMAMVKKSDRMAAKKPRRLHWQDPEHTRVKREKKNCYA
jgi:hypothetical protein